MGASAHLLVGGDDHPCADILDAVAQALCRESADDNRMRGPNARAGLHCDDAFDAHRHVDDDTVALLYAAPSVALAMRQVRTSHLW